MSNKYETLLERFLSYVKIDTQSDEKNESTPSTKKQFDLAEILEKELKDMGLKNVEVDEYCYVYATLPSNIDNNNQTIGLISHIDTAPAVSGKNVNPIVNKNYQGGDIVLPGDKTVVIEEDDDLKKHIGEDIITSDGTTLLGGDDKAGVSEIMEALKYLIEHPEIKRPEIRIAFTPDEEIGRGTIKFDKEKFGAKLAYTIDGGADGEIEDENFNADSMVIKIKGINVHPGYAKGKMVNSIKIAGDFLANLPKDMSPETTEKKEGYVHPVEVSGNEEETTIFFIIRDFVEDGLKQKEDMLEELVKKSVEKFPGASYTVEIKESYRNMKKILDKNPEVVNLAIKAIENSGITPIRTPIRGGTDGAKLTFEGIPTPNLFTGGHNFHSKREWISYQSMEKAVDVIINLVKLWAEKNNG
jgi:tripeptide aminopeptidase